MCRQKGAAYVSTSQEVSWTVLAERLILRVNVGDEVRGDPYAIGVRQTCGLTKDMSGPRGAHWPRSKRRGHVLGFDLAQSNVMPASTGRATSC
ncbi:hypothetical protein RchiOBHm_Chr1g0351431 [Rosa chinensis]|uniref:Uncharacterized protein n=1 Tax=Rosa chinensis TaxID=74649 RepID=A0A2P6SGA7_ROSCH|nr:hypothetical protein RchiOBHm_Chr1g0351431 [Rosa chinensis]